jgi:cytochrome c oxidase assembly protein subunit 11
VTFYVDPEIAEDKNLDDVKTITLSYTFFRDQDADAAREAAAVVTEEKTRVN